MQKTVEKKAPPVSGEVGVAEVPPDCQWVDWTLDPIWETLREDYSLLMKRMGNPIHFVLESQKE